MSRQSSYSRVKNIDLKLQTYMRNIHKCENNEAKRSEERRVGKEC